MDTLAALHAVDWRAAGLADVGRPEEYNLRHLRRMRRLVAEPPPGFAEVEAWLEGHVPTESAPPWCTTSTRLGNVVSGRRAG